MSKITKKFRLSKKYSKIMDKMILLICALLSDITLAVKAVKSNTEGEVAV